MLVAFVCLAVLVGAAAWWALDTDGPGEPRLAGDTERHTTSVDGLDRTWTSYVPDGLEGPAPVVLVLHGSLQDGAAIRTETAFRFDELADEHGWVIAYPDGYEDNWNECRAGGEFPAKTEDVADVEFMSAIVDSLDADLTEGVDEERVFATGYSSGGQMALRLALEAPDLVAAVAPVAASVPTEDNMRCSDVGTPVPALFIQGTEDPMNPYEGGEVELFAGIGSRGDVLSAEESAAWMAARNRATGPTSRETGTGDERAEFHDWSGPSPVRLVVVVGGGHHYPADGYRGRRLLGPSSHAVDGPTEVWSFFDEVSNP